MMRITTEEGSEGKSTREKGGARGKVVRKIARNRFIIGGDPWLASGAVDYD